MKYSSALLAFLLSSLFFLPIAAQELIPSPLEELTTDLKARTEKRYDLNDIPCALIRIEIPILTDLQIEGRLGVVGEVGYNPGEYFVYVPEGTNRLIIRHPNFTPCTVTFDKVKRETTYRLVLRLPENNSNNTIVRIKTNVQKATLAINGKVFETEDAEFNVPLPKGEYDYTITAKVPGFENYTGHFSIDGKDIVKEIEKVSLVTRQQNVLTIYADKGAEVIVDGKSMGNSKGISTVSLLAGIHTIEVKFGENGKFYEKRLKDLSEGNDSVNMIMQGTLRITSPKGASFVLTPIGESVAPSAKTIESGQMVQLLGSYKVVAKKKKYNTAEVRVNVGKGEHLNNYHIRMTSEADNLYYGLNGKKMNREKAKLEYQKLINSGDDQAMYQLGVVFEDEGNMPAAIKAWKRAAENGNEDACIAIYKNTSNPSEKREYALKAANAGNSEAMEKLGDIYYGSMGKNYIHYPEAVKWYSLAYENGNTKVATKLGECYFQGCGVEKDLNKAKSYFIEGKGIDALADERLADFTYFGYGEKRDQQQALRVYNRLYNQHSASDDAIYKLMISQYKAKNYVKFVELFNGLKNQNYVLEHTDIDFNAMERVAHELLNTNPDCALTLFEAAVTMGSTKATTYDQIGKLYFRGRGVPKDIQRAKTWLQKASDGGNGEGSFFLGNCYQESQDYNSALKAYQKAVRQGYDIANGYIGTLYSKGWGVPKDFDKAVAYWAKAAEKGHEPSINNLVKYYKFKKDYAEAERWSALLK